MVVTVVHGITAVSTGGSSSGSTTTFSGNVTVVGTFTTASRVLGLTVITATGAYNILSTDDQVVINKTVGGATTVNLPTSPTTGRTLTVKDGKGDAATNNITVTPAAGNIDGSSTFVINVNYQSNDFVYNGTQWNVV